jgi:hypothetical protein
MDTVIVTYSVPVSPREGRNGKKADGHFVSTIQKVVLAASSLTPEAIIAVCASFIGQRVLGVRAGRQSRLW